MHQEIDQLVSRSRNAVHKDQFNDRKKYIFGIFHQISVSTEQKLFVEPKKLK